MLDQASTSIVVPSSLTAGSCVCVCVDELVAEMTVTCDGRLDASRLTEAVQTWLDERVHERVSQRVAELETLVQERVMKARSELETRLRSQIEQELRLELDACRRREVRASPRGD